MEKESGMERQEWEMSKGGGNEGNKDLTVLRVLLGILRGKQSRRLCT